MKSTAGTRTYNMRKRAEAAARNEALLLEATAGLWREMSLADITLDKVAERTGLTVRTILRKFGSRDGLIQACIERDAARIEHQRNQAPAGDIPGIIDALMDHYEANGDAVLRTLTLEDELPAAKALLEHGRKYHRQWCAEVFAGWLDGDATRLTAFVAATDIYLWKLMRRDLKLSIEETRQAFGHLLYGLTTTKNLNHD